MIKEISNTYIYINNDNNNDDHDDNNDDNDPFYFLIPNLVL